MPLAAAWLAAAAIIAAAADLVSADHPFGWLGAMMISALAGLTLWRAGSVKAWKETAEAREQRIDDLEAELVNVRAQCSSLTAELAIPERLEGIIGLMGEMAVRQDAAASLREEAMIERINRAADQRVENLARRLIESRPSTTR